MNRVSNRFLITALSSIALGALAIVPVVRSDNGYAAGFVFLPIACLLAFLSLILIFAGLVLIAKTPGPYLLVAALLIPGSFIGAALVAKNLELGAYREEPMEPLTPSVSNIVLLKKKITNDEVNSFWNQTLSTEREDSRGHDHLPGIRGITRLPAKDGHEVVEFGFFPDATEEQRQFVYSRVRSSPLVFELLENVSTDEYMPRDDTPSSDDRPKKQVSVNGIIKN